MYPGTVMVSHGDYHIYTRASTLQENHGDQQQQQKAVNFIKYS